MADRSAEGLASVRAVPIRRWLLLQTHSNPLSKSSMPTVCSIHGVCTLLLYIKDVITGLPLGEQ